MANRKLHNVHLFLAGDPISGKPFKAYVQYELVSGNAKEKAKVYEIPDPDTSLELEVFWANFLKEIKKIEKIKE